MKQKKRNDNIQRFKDRNFAKFKNKHNDFLEKDYQCYLDYSKKELKEDFEYFKVEYNFWCYMNWKALLDINKGEVFSPYMLADGKFDIAGKIRDFIREYSNEVSDIPFKDLEVMKKVSVANTKYFYKIFYLIYCSMLGAESIYFEKVYKAITKTKLYKDSSETNQKKFFNELYQKIDVININEKLTKENIELDKKVGKKKQLIKKFINFYNDNRQRFPNVVSCFDNFKIDYPEIENDSYESFKKLIYKYKCSLKKVYRE